VQSVGHVAQQPLAGEEAGIPADLHDRLAEMLLNAHDVAMQQQGGVDLEWRLAFLQVLQQAAALHGPLLRLLLGSMAGELDKYEPQQVSVHMCYRIQV
jgi:hypothetical protein